MTTRLRRRLRLAMFVLIGLIGAVITLTATFLIVLHTDWGREQLRSRLEGELNKMVTGSVTLGKITGSPLGKLEVAGLSVRSPAGKPLITVGTFAMDWAPLALVSKTFHARAIEITGPVIVGEREPDGSLDLAHILRPAEEAAANPSTWTTRIDRLTVRDGVLVMPMGPSEKLSLASLKIDGRIKLTPELTDVILDEVSGTWLERGLPLVLRGRLVSSLEVTSVSHVRLTNGETRVDLPTLIYSPRDGAIAAIVDGKVAGAELARFVPNLAGYGELRLSGVVFRGKLDDPFLAKLHGELRGAAFAADLDVDAVGKDLETLQGTAMAVVRGELAGGRLDRLRLAVSAIIEDGTVHATGAVSAMGARGQLFGRLKLGREMRVDALVLDARVPDLGAFAQGARGVAEIDVRLSGPLDAIGGKVVVKGQKVGFGKDEIGPVSLVATIAGGRRADVSFSAGAIGSTYAGTVDARVVRGEAATTVSFGDLRLVTRGIVWTGRGGELVLREGGGVSANLALASDVGKVAATGELDGDGKLHLHVVSLDLGRLRAALAPAAPEIAGKLSFDGHLVKRGRALELDATLDATGLVAHSSVPPVDAKLRLALAGGKLVATGWVRERRRQGAAVDLDVDASVPRDPLDLAAWRQVQLDTAVRTASLRVRDVDLAELGRWTGQRDWRGRLAFSVILRPGSRVLELVVAGRGIGTPQVRGVDVDLDAAWGRESLTFTAAARAGGGGPLTAKGTAHVGLNAVLQHPGRVAAARISATFTGKDVALTDLRRALGSTVAASGKLTLDAQVAGTLTAPTGKLKLVVADAHIAGVPFAQLDADATIDGRRIDAAVKVRQRAGGTLDAQAKIDLEKGNALDAELHAAALDLAFLAALTKGKSGALGGAAGRLDADLALGTARAPRGTATITSGKFYVPALGPVTDLQLALRLEQGKLIVEKLEGRAGEGTIRVNGQATLVGVIPAALDLTVAVRDLPAAAGPLPVKVTTSGKLLGKTRDDGVLVVDANLDEVEIKLPREIVAARPLQQTGALEDVIYTDVADLDQRTAYLALVGVPEVKNGGAAGLSFLLNLNTAKGVHVFGAEADVNLRQQLHVTYRGGESLIRGSIQAESGYLFLFDRRWDVSTANVSFRGEEGPPNPRLNVVLSHEFRTTTVYIQVTGTMRDPKLELRADPGTYSQQQILSWVLGGSPDEAQGDRPPIADAAVGVASNLLLGQVQRQLKQILPFDVLSVRQGEGADTQTTRIEVGKWLTDRLFLGYRVRLNSPTEDKNLNEANVQWRFAKRWILEAFFGDKGVGGADAIWSKKY